MYIIKEKLNVNIFSKLYNIDICFTIYVAFIRISILNIVHALIGL